MLLEMCVPKTRTFHEVEFRLLDSTHAQFNQNLERMLVKVAEKLGLDNLEAARRLVMEWNIPVWPGATTVMVRRRGTRWYYGILTMDQVLEGERYITRITRRIWRVGRRREAAMAGVG